MKLNFNKYLISACVLASLTSCMDDLRDINTDPDNMPSTRPEYMFTAATQNFLNSTRAHLTGLYGGAMAQMQYLTSKSGVDGNGHFVDPASIDGRSVYSPAWDDFYSRGRDLREVMNEIGRIDAAEQAQYQGLKAICQVLEVYQAWLVAETTGAMPYTEAFKGREEELLTPKYDLVQDLYKLFDENLKTSASALTNNANYVSLGTQDFFFKGDYTKWLKFTNAFRLRLAMRFQKADPAHFESVYSEVSNPELLPSSNDESCFYRHPKDFNNNIDDINQIWQSYQTTKAYVEFLKNSADPRLRLVVRGNEFRSDIDKYNQALAKYPEIAEMKWATDNYWGAPVSPKAVQDTLNWITGLEFEGCPRPGTPDQLDDITLRPTCLIQGRYFAKNGGYKEGEDNDNSAVALRKPGDEIKTKTALITYSDVCFMLAECALEKGSAAGRDANSWYQDGIRSSVDMYMAIGQETFVAAAVNNPVTSTEVETFLASPYGQLSGSNEQQKEMILSQMWVHGLTNANEMYAQWKRTGYPKFESESPYQYAAVLEDPYTVTGIKLTMPRRRNLPSSTHNAYERDLAMQKLLADPAYRTELDTKGRIWWDKE